MQITTRKLLLTVLVVVSAACTNAEPQPSAVERRVARYCELEQGLLTTEIHLFSKQRDVAQVMRDQLAHAEWHQLDVCVPDELDASWRMPCGDSDIVCPQVEALRALLWMKLARSY